MKLADTVEVIFSQNAQPEAREQNFKTTAQFKEAIAGCEYYRRALNTVGALLLADNPSDFIDDLNITIATFMAVGYQIAKHEEGVFQLESYILGGEEPAATAVAKEAPEPAKVHAHDAAEVAVPVKIDIERHRS